MKPLLVPVLCLSPALCLPAPAGQERPGPAAGQAGEVPRFPSGAELVTVDAVVTTKDGQPVAGLARDDFFLAEDDAPQAIIAFETVRVRDAPAASVPARPRLSTNAPEGPRAGRSFVVVFDDLHLTPFQARPAKAAVAEFLRSAVGDGDRVSLIASGGESRWDARLAAGREDLMAVLQRLEGLHRPDTAPDALSDHEAVRIHLFKDTQVGERVRRRFRTQGIDLHDTLYRARERGIDALPGVNHPFVEARAAQVYQRVRARDRGTLAVMEQALSGLGAERGRKSLLLVSGGFVHDPSLDEFRQVVEAARRANAALYFFDARGLTGLSSTASAEYGPPLVEQDLAFSVQDLTLDTEGPESLALASGGFTVKNTNDLTPGMQRIARESSTYYLLGYEPSNTRNDGRFRRIKVQVKREGLRVRARTGYYAPPPSAPTVTRFERVEAALRRGLGSAYGEPGLPLRATALVFEGTAAGGTRVLLATDVDVRSCALAAEGGRLVGGLEAFTLVTARDTGKQWREQQKVTMNLSPETRERVARTGYTLTQRLELPPGTYQGRITVRDAGSGRQGTVVHIFEVSDPGGWRVSTPLVSDTLQDPSGAQGPPRPAVVARRSFPAGSVLFCAFDVYGAAREAATGRPRVSAGYLLQQAGGAVRRQREPTSIAPSAEGNVSRLLGIPLEDAPPGEYELVLSVRDELAGRSEQLREPFTVEAAPLPR